MPQFSYKKASTVLTEQDVGRLARAYLMLTEQAKLTKEDYGQVATELGIGHRSATNVVSGIVKKLRDNCFVEKEDDVDEQAAPKAKAVKRKAMVEAAEDSTLEAGRASRKADCGKQDLTAKVEDVDDEI